MAVHQCTLQLRAIVLILLLGGAHCTRIQSDLHIMETGADVHLEDLATQEGVGNELGYLSQGIGRAVCTKSDFKFTDPTLLIHRYRQKATTILELASKVKGQKPSIKDLITLALREKKLLSCTKFPRDSQIDQIPPEVMAIMFTGNYSMMVVGGVGLVAALASVKKQGRFRSEGACGFHPELLNIHNASVTSDPNTTLLAQLLGQGCTGNVARLYLDGLPRLERQAVAKTIQFVELAVARVRGAVTEKEFEQATRDAYQEVDGVLSKRSDDSSMKSLLELGALPLAATVVVSVVVWVILAIIIVFIAFLVVFWPLLWVDDD